MAVSTYHQMSVQHIRYLDQSHSLGLVRLAHQHHTIQHQVGAQLQHHQADFNQDMEQLHQCQQGSEAVGLAHRQGK
jgi:hypothetical protein